MTTEFNDDQQQFRDVVKRFFTDKSPVSAVRRLMAEDGGYDAEVWQQLGAEVGLAGAHIPQVYGGYGFGPVELGIIAEEMGRTLYCGPFFASAVMAGYALLGGADEACKHRLLPGIADGSTIATLVLDDLNQVDQSGRGLHGELLAGAHAGTHATTDAGADSEEGADGASHWRLTGAVGLVLDAQVASVFLCVAATDNGLGLFLVGRDEPNLVIEPLEVIDPTRKLSRLQFNQVRAEKLGELNGAAMALLWDQLSVVLAHEMIGGAQMLLDSTVEYMKLRMQFGRPIASFQALKHRCADLLLELELAKAVTRQASHFLASAEGPRYLPSMAKAMASDTYMSLARAGVQLRGGIGFTWENDTHLWFKRAKSSEVFLGSPYLHRERMMTMIQESDCG
ncbi:acyl-CoA/acyl-ACP dehydrogenase [Pseudomonadales bacterium]|nr:acyl-CoA/acyl-ACP dehydrogenase [Pseudomonadales bacterium]